MPLHDLTDWMDEFARPEYLWYVKRLSGNDTLANGSHQAGPYIPKDLLFKLFPALHQPENKNPRVTFDLSIDSYHDARPVTAIWYNNKWHGGTRNETRLTGFGGGSSSLLDPESTGALTIFAFRLNATECHVWVCRHPLEEDLIEDRIGVIEPGEGKVKTFSVAEEALFGVVGSTGSCWLEQDQLPASWLTRFPAAAEIISKTLELCPNIGMTPDERLMKRRQCEYDLFRSLEEAIVMPRLGQGFTTVPEFLEFAQTILQRRRARSGRSLELHVREIFKEEQFVEGRDFSWQPESEPGKRPDFLFPSESHYKDPHFPAGKLRMLAVKTTCKDRWRQVLQEANRIEHVHLLTLQEGVSENQFKEMTDAKVHLVVPSSLHDSYPKAVREHLQTFEDFIGDIRLSSL
jgi:hypothetical protein